MISRSQKDTRITIPQFTEHKVRKNNYTTGIRIKQDLNKLEHYESREVRECKFCTRELKSQGLLM